VRVCVCVCGRLCVCAGSGGCQCVGCILGVYVGVECPCGICLWLFVGVAGRGVGLLCLLCVVIVAYDGEDFVE